MTLIRGRPLLVLCGVTGFVTAIILILLVRDNPKPLLTTEAQVIEFAEEHLCKPGTVTDIRNGQVRWGFYCVTAGASLDIYDCMGVDIYGHNAGPCVLYE